jgi:hypothetical protein
VTDRLDASSQEGSYIVPHQIPAIETRYAGCRFRSRLEARYAVFFDHLGIAWEYEPEGFETSQRLTLGPEKVWYLPDFWLPTLGVYAEVKATLTEPECVRLLDIAASLSSSDGGGCHDSGGHDLIVLGPVPRRSTVPARLHMHKGCLLAARFNFGVGRFIDPCRGEHLACDLGGDGIFEQYDLVRHDHQWHPSSEFLENAKHLGQFLLNGMSAYELDGLVAPAHRAARSARFEHGEQG